MLGRFKLSVPASATSELIEEGTTLACQLMPGRDPLYVKRFDLADPYSPDQRSLEDEAQRFLDEGIMPVCEQIVGSSIERGEVNGTHFAQLVVRISDAHWWLARVVSKPMLRSYFLLHCSGDQEYLVLATAVLTEFYVLE